MIGSNTWRTVKQRWQLPLQADEIDFTDTANTQRPVTERLSDLVNEITR